MRFFLKAVREHATPLQVCGCVGPENTFLANHMTLLWNASHNDCAGGRAAQNTRFDSIWRECNTTVKDRFKKQFRNLECLGMLKKRNILTFGSHEGNR